MGGESDFATFGRRARAVLLVGLVAVGCQDPKPGTTSASAPVPSGSAVPTVPTPPPVATPPGRKRCLYYEARPEFGDEWEVKKYRAFECFGGYQLWARDADGKPGDQRKKPDVVVELCERDTGGYTFLDASDRKGRGKYVKVVLPTALINAYVEKNRDLELSGQLAVERQYEDGVSEVLVATFQTLTLTQLGSLLEALTQAPGQPWPEQKGFLNGPRCHLFTTKTPNRWDILQLLAP